MPSIEIVCVDQSEPLEVADLPFAVLADGELVSHRSPRPRFVEEFDRLKGCMYHLGNPDLTADGPFFAKGLLSEECRERQPPTFLEFAPDFVAGIHQLLCRLLEGSPAGRLLFTSDWQFGPKEPTRGGDVALSKFWMMHDHHQLRLNGSYGIVAGEADGV